MASVWRLGRPTPHEWHWQRSVRSFMNSRSVGGGSSNAVRGHAWALPCCRPQPTWPAHQLASRRWFSQSPWLASTSRVRGGRSIGAPSSSVRLQTSRSMICRAWVWWPSASVTAARSRRLISSYGAARRAAATASRATVEVSCRQAVGGDDVRDVDDRTDQVVVEPVTAVHPGPAGGAELVEWLPGDQGERSAEVGDAVAAAGLAADP